MPIIRCDRIRCLKLDSSPILLDTALHKGNLFGVFRYSQQGISTNIAAHHTHKLKFTRVFEPGLLISEITSSLKVWTIYFLILMYIHLYIHLSIHRAALSHKTLPQTKTADYEGKSACRILLLTSILSLLMAWLFSSCKLYVMTDGYTFTLW